MGAPFKLLAGLGRQTVVVGSNNVLNDPSFLATAIVAQNDLQWLPGRKLVRPEQLGEGPSIALHKGNVPTEVEAVRFDSFEFLTIRIHGNRPQYMIERCKDNGEFVGRPRIASSDVGGKRLGLNPKVNAPVERVA
jgi:hypothetical protein